MEIDAGAAGFDVARLARIDEHLSRSYIEPGKIAGCQTLVARRGKVAHLSSLGSMDLERDRPVRYDTIWRLYSMTKPITGVALMTLYERGYFQLDDPVHRFIPSWRGIKVSERDADGSSRLVEPLRPPTVRDVLMHTAGLGYGPANADLALPEPGSGTRGFTTDRYESLEVLVEELAGAPLRFHPGTHWLYSFGTDVCARLVEVISGMRFDEYLQQELFDPLGMVDTGFVVGDDDVERFATGYGRSSKKELVVVDDPDESPYRKPRSFLSGGGGLVGTTADYFRFCQMLLDGGVLEGVRILAPRTVELMTINHLPGDAQLADVARPGAYGETGFEGMGFGLTMAVSRGPAETGVSGTPGEFMWGGAASTTFWVAPVDELVVVFMTQLIPSGTFNFRGQLKALVHAAMTD